jgi:hypothetical protein
MSRLNRYASRLLVIVLMGALAFAALPASAQGVVNPLLFCQEGAFSTEEDFVMLQQTPFDGNIYVSDGDLLSIVGGQVCARNRQLTKVFKAGADLGLDAVDLFYFPQANAAGEVGIVVFSTELDHRRGLFTAGDLLSTQGGVIPNKALTHLFKINQDVGLDAVQLIGKPENIRRFLGLMKQYSPLTNTAGPSKWLEGRLQAILKRLQVDIWFSIEGTWGRNDGLILDGDILSAASGTIVAKQSELLPGIGVGGPYPTDPRTRGVDFGVDGLAASITGDPKLIHFSTEILYKNADLGFFDGDVLQTGGAVRFVNEDFVAPFVPAVFYLGLDALYLPESYFSNPNPDTPPQGGSSLRGN